MSDKATRKEIIASIEAWAEENNFVVTFLGGSMGGTREDYADAIVGTVDEPRPAIVYLRSAVIMALAEMSGGDVASAIEWYDYNIVRGLSYVKPKDGPPILVDDVIPF